MAGLAFLDTNILVYAQDSRVPAKQQIAKSLVRELLRSGEGVISTQVVQEFCAVALHPQKALTLADLKLTFEEVLRPLLAHFPDADFYQRTLDLYQNQDEQLSFYDALIVQAAIDLGCQKLYSEDLQAGRSYGGVTIENPFIKA